VLRAVPFDPDRLAVEGRPVPLINGVGVSNGDAAFAVSDDGRLVYASGNAENRSAVWVDRTGRFLSLIAESVFGSPRLSPDESRLAVRVDSDVWVADLERGGITRLSVEGVNHVPAWMGDSSTVTFGSDRGASINLYSKSADGGGTAELLLDTPETLIPGSWSSDGETLLYYQTTDATNRDIWSLSANGDSAPVLATEFDELAPRLSPNGQWLAYVSDQTGEDRIYMRAFPIGERVVPVSTGPGAEPMWSRDGRELFYRAGNAMMVVDIGQAAEPIVARPRILFEGAFALDPNGVGIPNYDVASDGRFVMVTGDATAQLVLVDNWFEELIAQVPAP
jgi:Tol biopolymer transport system component